MCGICGFYYSRSSKPADRDLLEQMCGRIVHRGPDEQGVHINGSVGLGMRRLSIIDLDTGSQPIFNEDGSICTVFNGEIYNFQALRNDLEKRGHHFKTKADTEVIVHLYEEHADDFVKHLNGMFAIAVWDSKRRRLILARDRLGQKPLYYAWTKDGLYFGSELKCLVQCESVPKDLDHKSVYHYFTLGYIPNPRTVYSGIKQLPPATRLVVEGDRVTTDRYWQPNCEVDRSRRREDVRDELRELLADAVRIRMISDVPLGAFLSGGLDSSIIVALMAEASSQPVKTFHVDFAEPEFSERRYARAVANRYETSHHELMVKPKATEIVEQLVQHFDEPFGDSSAVPTYYISELTRQHVTVALAGDGGDESFGGYTRYQEIMSRRRMPTALRNGLGMVGNLIHHCLPRRAPGRRYFRSLGLDNDTYYTVGTAELETRELLDPGFLTSVNGTTTASELKPMMERGDRTDRLSPYSTLDLYHYLPDDILTKVDRTSMAHSLELRAPLLDYRVVELAARMPCEWKTHGGISKIILKETFADLLPAEVLEQRKRGFSLPLASWLRNELRPAVEEAIHDRELGDAGIFRMEEVRSLAQEHLSGTRDRRSLLWSFLFFARWWHASRC